MVAEADHRRAVVAVAAMIAAAVLVAARLRRVVARGVLFPVGLRLARLLLLGTRLPLRLLGFRLACFDRGPRLGLDPLCRCCWARFPRRVVSCSMPNSTAARWWIVEHIA